MKHKELILEVSQELQNHLYDYISVEKLAKRLKIEWRTARGAVDLIVNKLKCLEVQHLPNGWENWEEDIVNWYCLYDGKQTKFFRKEVEGASKNG